MPKLRAPRMQAAPPAQTDTRRSRTSMKSCHKVTFGNRETTSEGRGETLGPAKRMSDCHSIIVITISRFSWLRPVVPPPRPSAGRPRPPPAPPRSPARLGHPHARLPSLGHTSPPCQPGRGLRRPPPRQPVVSTTVAATGSDN